MEDIIKNKNYFEGEHIDLLAFEKKDINMVLKWVNNEKINKTNGARFPISIYEETKWYEGICSDKKKQKLIIATKRTEKIGMISLSNIDYKNQNSEIGIYIIPNYQRKGYAKEALNLLLKFVFYEFNMHKIYALIYNYNISSLNLFQSVGFQHESTNKEVVYSQGKFIDIYVYSIFKKDFIIE